MTTKMIHRRKEKRFSQLKACSCSNAKLTKISIQESASYSIFESSVSGRVDEEAGIIYGVCILGPNSANKDGKVRRKYDPQAMQAAISLYESAMVNCDHPPGHDPNHDREIDKRFGKLRGIRFEDGKLRGDLVYLKSHPMAQRVVEAAKNPELNSCFGFSHDADLDIKWGEDGSATVVKISRVRAVDLVADPATTLSLFESNKEDKTVDDSMNVSGVTETPGAMDIESEPLDQTIDALISQYLPEMKAATDLKTRKSLAKALGDKINTAIGLFISDPEDEEETSENAEESTKTEYQTGGKESAADASDKKEDKSEEKVEESKSDDKEEKEEVKESTSCSTKESRIEKPGPKPCSYDEAITLLSDAGVPVTLTRVKQIRSLESRADREDAVKDWASLINSIGQSQGQRVNTRSGSKPESIPAHVTESKKDTKNKADWSNDDFAKGRLFRR